ncbi:MAG TPA: VIT domain-containing protein [Thermomicrobiales bacterium]|nr:VIT domain-containing protein [Thermomicrobiales bacterium]
MRARMVHGLAALLMLLTVLATATGVNADGVVVVTPPDCDPECGDVVYIGDQLVVKEHHVEVAIENQLATTEIDQTFHNPNDWVAEGTYLFPVPQGATIDQFTMTVDGKEIEAQILEADEAREIYENIVSQLRDPALLEYLGQNVIQASIFPIQPGEDANVQIRYQQVLTAEGGVVHYRYPLNTERFSAAPLESVSVHVEVASDQPVRAVYSPSHEIAVDKQDDEHFTAGWEANEVKPDTDFDLFYTLSGEAIGVNLLSYWSEDDDQGTFMLLAAPGIPQQETAISKDVIVVLDTSGSMEGEKLAQAKEALVYILQNLNEGDRFTIVEFSTGVRLYDDDLLSASDAQHAIEWVENLESSGGTDIDGALSEAMELVENERPTYVLFLTDGLPTEGETDPAEILDDVSETAPDNVRLFAFGVGDDVDTFLLDNLTSEHHGASSYVRPGERLDETVSNFYAKISTPLLTDVELTIDGVDTEEIYPTPLPDIFAGSQLVIVGHYKDGGSARIELKGKIDGKETTYIYEGQTFTSDDTVSTESLPRLWATRKIGYLMNQIRLQGEQKELTEAIIDLSIRYGIVTPYTSYLITDDDILTQTGRADAAQESYDAAVAVPMETTGGAAVDAAATSASMAEANAAAPTQFQEEGVELRAIGDRAFLFKDGVWTETTFDPETMEPIQVEFASDEYFALLAEHPDLAVAFALGDHVIALSDGVAYEVAT